MIPFHLRSHWIDTTYWQGPFVPDHMCSIYSWILVNSLQILELPLVLRVACAPTISLLWDFLFYFFFQKTDLFLSIYRQFGQRNQTICFVAFNLFSCHFPTSNSFLCFNLIMHPLSFVMSIYFLVRGSPLGYGQPAKSHALKENWLILSQKTSTLHISWVRDEGSWIPSHSMLEHWLAWSCAGLVRATTVLLSSWIQWSCHPLW